MDSTIPSSSPPGYCMYHLLRHITLYEYFAHTMCLFVSRNSHNEQRFLLRSINPLTTRFLPDLSISGSTSLVGPWPLFSFLIYSVGLLGRGISPPQGNYIYRATETQNKRDKHPCLEWDSNPWSQCSCERRHFKAQTAWPLRLADFFQMVYKNPTGCIWEPYETHIYSLRAECRVLVCHNRWCI
jgi:hypothetical protein